jgi:hypothetical protein
VAITSGSDNVIIGKDADASIAAASNQIVIGANATRQGDNYAVIGNADITRLYAAQDAGATLYAAGLNLGNTAVTSTATELNIVDGGTSATTTTVVDADRLILNDDGTMKQIAVTDLNTYLGSATKLDDLFDAMIESNSMYIGNDPESTTSTAEYNVAVGTTALDAITTGDNNVAVGYNALTDNTTGSQNIAIGKHAMQRTTAGFDNIAIGDQALRNTGETSNAGSYNVGVGRIVLGDNVTLCLSAPHQYFWLQLHYHPKLSYPRQHYMNLRLKFLLCSLTLDLQ